MNGEPAYIGLGSNLDNPVAQVTRAMGALAQLPLCRMTARSPLYRSEPLGPRDQPDYINAVVCLETRLPPKALLSALQAIEQAQQRVRLRRWGARTLDLDLLLYGDLAQSEPDLILPHPRMHERAFVLYPLGDIAPDLSIAGLGALRVLRQHCPSLRLERLPYTGGSANGR